MFGNIFKKRRRHLVTDHVKNNDLIEPDKNKLLKGEIILTHCRGHDTILTFLFEGFHGQHVRLLSRNYGYR